MDVDGEDDSLRKLSESGTRAWPIEGIVSGMMLRKNEIQLPVR
jgi:hypothetical protein